MSADANSLPIPGLVAADLEAATAKLERDIQIRAMVLHIVAAALPFSDAVQAIIVAAVPPPFGPLVAFALARVKLAIASVVESNTITIAPTTATQVLTAIGALAGAVAEKATERATGSSTLGAIASHVAIDAADAAAGKIAKGLEGGA